MKAILYARVSTEEQQNDGQLIELRTEALKRGWEVVAEVVDVMSGARAERPGLGRAMEMVRSRAATIIACVKLDRVARSTLNFAKLVEELDALGGAVVCTSQSIDTSSDNASWRLQRNIMAAFAEFERDLIRDRTRAGLVAARARGAVLGRPSPKMVGVDRAAVCQAWDGTGGYAELGKRLGGISRKSAWRVWRSSGRR